MRNRLLTLVVVALVATAAALVSGQGAGNGGTFGSRRYPTAPICSRAGSALVEVALPAGVEPSALKVQMVGGEHGAHDVTAAFARRANGKVPGSRHRPARGGDDAGRLD